MVNISTSWGDGSTGVMWGDGPTGVMGRWLYRHVKGRRLDRRGQEMDQQT